MRPVRVGDIVRYCLTAGDAQEIANRRTKGLGHGNATATGDIVPLIVVQVWDNGSVNGQAILDGNDQTWITSASHGSGPGTWKFSDDPT